LVTFKYFQPASALSTQHSTEPSSLPSSLRYRLSVYLKPALRYTEVFMVTRMQLGEYTVRVTVEGKEVEHYSIEGDETKKEVTCWIASTEGKVANMNTPSERKLTVTILVFCTASAKESHSICLRSLPCCRWAPSRQYYTASRSSSAYQQQRDLNWSKF